MQFQVLITSLDSSTVYPSRPFDTLAEAIAEARKTSMRTRRTCRVVRIEEPEATVSIDENGTEWVTSKYEVDEEVFADYLEGAM